MTYHQKCLKLFTEGSRTLICKLLKKIVVNRQQSCCAGERGRVLSPILPSCPTPRPKEHDWKTTFLGEGALYQGENSKMYTIQNLDGEANFKKLKKKNLTFANLIGNKTEIFRCVSNSHWIPISEFQVFLKILENTGAVKSNFLIQEFNLGCNLKETHWENQQGFVYLFSPNPEVSQGGLLLGTEAEGSQ